MEKINLEKEFNALCLLYMYHVNNEYYKEKYEMAKSGTTISSKLFGSENEYRMSTQANQLYKSMLLKVDSEGYKNRTGKRMEDLALLLFSEDMSGEFRIKWGLDFVLSIDSLFEKKIMEKGLSYISKIVFLNENVLSTILKSFKDNWCKIQSNTTFNKKIAITAGIIAYIALTVLTDGATLLAPGNLNVVLSTLGGGSLASGGLGMIGGSMLLSAVSAVGAIGIGGVTYKINQCIEKKKILEDFRNMSSETISYMLANMITFIQFSKRVNSNNTLLVNEVLSVLVELDLDNKKEYLIYNQGQNDELKKKNEIIKMAFAQLEKYF